MNELLLKGGNSKFSEHVAKQCSKQLIVDWSQYAQSNKLTEIPDLIKFLYRWSTNGIFLSYIKH